ncbi:MAG: glycoside hydrolase family 3 protein [Treponema sp.]|jgi:beta-N-acetylhexosaminidase|nr:glycoside hydrolase family 3 protein [Treponema sp.]
MRFLYASVLCLLLLPACARHENVDPETITIEEESEETAAADPIQIRAEEIALSLDDRLLAAQILVCGIDGKGGLPPHMKTLLEEFPAGAVMLFRYNLDTDNDSIRVLLSQTVSLINGESGIPPFMAVDHEGGTVNRFRRGTADLPAASSYWELFLEEGLKTALEKIENDSFKSGSEISGLGINMNFAPVAELLNAGNRDFLQSRSYGPDPLFTAEAAAAFVRGMERAGVLCVVKHFPGSAGSDPHYSSSVLNGDRAALDSLVFPFAALIKNGARAVMAAHSSVPALDTKIASLSPAVMEDWLKRDLGFNGIIISDDFSMAAAGRNRPEEAAVESIAAGADMVLVWPANIRRTHRALISALEDGRLSRERIREAAQRVIYEKIRMGLLNGE